MSTREAACSCGQLRVETEGDPVRVSLCHCLACQRRSGSAFAIQAWFESERVKVVGRYSDWVRRTDEDGDERVFHFCPECGATAFYTVEEAPDYTGVPVGLFADPSFPPPTISHYESRRHPWVVLPAAIERDELWAAVQPLYAAGEYAEAADRGRELLEAHPESGRLLYNVACCESLAGRTDDAIEHLRRAVNVHEPLRLLAAGDSDFEPIRDDPAFRELMG